MDHALIFAVSVCAHASEVLLVGRVDVLLLYVMWELNFCLETISNSNLFMLKSGSSKNVFSYTQGLQFLIS